MNDPLFILLRTNPCGEVRACGVTPVTKGEAISQARDLREGIVEPGVKFSLQPIQPVALEV
ncbi:MAG: hypothetical protein AAFY81_07090 [Pseudomonadota bacterium]